MKRIFGYCRVSTKSQRLDRQIENIRRAYGDEVTFYCEKYTGTRFDGRKEFLALSKRVRAGDTIVFDSVSRMSRNAAEGVENYFELMSRDINLVFLKERHIDTEAFKAMKQKQIEVVMDSGSQAMDNLVSTIIEALNRYAEEILREQIRIAFLQSEKEVQDLHLRIAEGIATTKRMNPEKQIGQKPGAKLNIKKKEPIKKKIKDLSRDFNGSNTDAEVIKIIGIARNTFYKYKKELIEESC